VKPSTLHRSFEYAITSRGIKFTRLVMSEPYHNRKTARNFLAELLLYHSNVIFRERNATKYRRRADGEYTEFEDRPFTDDVIESALYKVTERIDSIESNPTIKRRHNIQQPFIDQLRIELDSFKKDLYA
jgi:hypothetical protein